MPTRKGQKINRPPKPIAERFPAKFVVDGSGCWLWQGRIGTNGYGFFFTTGNDGRRNRLAHRVAYELFVGPIPEGLTIDHLCRVRHCVNPKHLEPVTMRENTMRGTSPTAKNAKKVVCKHGHEFTEANTYLNPDGLGRRCRECMRADCRRRRARPKEIAA